MSDITNITTCNILTPEIFNQCLKMKKQRRGLDKIINKISAQTELPYNIIQQEFIDRNFLFIDEQNRLRITNTEIRFIERENCTKYYLSALREAIRYKKSHKSTLHAMVQISKKENLENVNVIALLLRKNIIKQHKESVRWTEHFNELLKTPITNKTS